VDDEWATRAAHAGLARARTFTWTESARTLHRAYLEAVARHRDSRTQRVRAAHA